LLELSLFGSRSSFPSILLNCFWVSFNNCFRFSFRCKKVFLFACFLFHHLSDEIVVNPFFSERPISLFLTLN